MTPCPSASRLALTAGCRWKRMAYSSPALSGSSRPSGRSEAVLAVERAAVRAQPDGAGMDHAEIGRVAVMRGAQQHAVRPARSRSTVTVCGPLTIGMPPSILRRRRFEEAAAGLVVEGDGGMRRGRARDLPPVLLVDRRQPAIDHQPLRPPRQFERQAAGMRFLADRDRRRLAGVHQQRGLPGVDALIAGMRRVRHRRAARVVIGEHGGEQIDRRRPHAVELREIAVGVAEEAQHRHHAVDGVVERGRRLQMARREQLAQRQQIDQQFDQHAGIAADMAAVGQDLPAQFVDQPARIAAQMTGLALQAERRVVERDHRLQARQAVARLLERAAQVAHLPRQAADEAAVEARVGVLQDEGRLAEPADDAARQDVEPPAERMPAALQVDPFVDQRAGIGAGDGGIGGAQMAQPGEAEQDHRPFVRGRRRFRRASGGRRSPPCRRRRSGRHRFRRRGWRRRCAGPAARSPGGRWRPSRSASAMSGWALKRRLQAAECAAPDEQGEPGPLRDGNPHHEAARPLRRGPIPAPRRTIAKGGRRANMPLRSVD